MPATTKIPHDVTVVRPDPVPPGNQMLLGATASALGVKSRQLRIICDKLSIPIIRIPGIRDRRLPLDAWPTLVDHFTGRTRIPRTPPRTRTRTTAS